MNLDGSTFLNLAAAIVVATGTLFDAASADARPELVCWY